VVLYEEYYAEEVVLYVIWGVICRRGGVIWGVLCRRGGVI
jgi:hypothetical protein